MTAGSSVNGIPLEDQINTKKRGGGYSCYRRKEDTTRKRAIAKALQLKGHPDFAPVDLAYYQHFLGFLFENIAFSEVPRGNHKCRSRGATPLVNNK